MARLIGLAVPGGRPPLGLWVRQSGGLSSRYPTGVVVMLALAGMLSGLCLPAWWSAASPLACWGAPLSILTALARANPRGLDPGPVGRADTVVRGGRLPRAGGAALGTALARTWLHVASRTPAERWAAQVPALIANFSNASRWCCPHPSHRRGRLQPRGRAVPR